MLSASTRAYDRGEKAAHYRHLPSLAEFLLVDPVQLGEDEYLERERAADTKSELVNGELAAMAGASPLHNAVATNILVALGSRLRGRPCRPLVRRP